ncbi:hypothetical protein J8M20_02915 [Pseudoalteromonas luteoviolacea]|uniref:hypothetical protein n=1 Tax=Pseudoalteromonas luteoviolacea TaxID=43657 RepID=UPI001B399376|nr:hypothetical protein [Pseudoalteromonas luteoviolacea]MBQ4810266.1 hypothetical protein [Pseudoalteromonas luteoviolacea]
MNQNLYFKTRKFDSARQLSNYMYLMLKNLSLEPEQPVDSEYMFIISTKFKGTKIDIFMGKNDEESDIPLWQIWAEERVSLFKKMFSKPNEEIEILLRAKLELLVKSIDDVSSVEWGI